MCWSCRTEGAYYLLFTQLHTELPSIQAKHTRHTSPHSQERPGGDGDDLARGGRTGNAEASVVGTVVLRTTPHARSV
eukprot:30102-Eustigmatos_ZCMA.PRE.1